MSEPLVWPNFFIVGVAKAGTTSLYAWLKQHPKVFMPALKEPHFFSSDLVKTPRFVVKSEEQYLRLFANAVGFKAIGEASASYFPFGEVVARRIKGKIPHAKIIVLLRDPVERAYADYLMYLRTGREWRPFYEALLHSPLSRVYIQPYAKPLQEWLEVFGRQQVLVLMFEELKENPRGLLSKVARFLEIDEGLMKGIRLFLENPGGTPRNLASKALLSLRQKVSVPAFPIPKGMKRLIRQALLAQKPPIDPRAIELLRPIFEEDLRELEALFRRELPELRKVW